MKTTISIIIAVLVMAISFSSISFAGEKKLDISERGVKGWIILDDATKNLADDDLTVRRMYNIDIIEKNSVVTQFGIVSSYLVTVDVDTVEMGKIKGVIYIYTGKNKNAQLCSSESFYADPDNSTHMSGYHDYLTNHRNMVKENTAVTIASLNLMTMTMK